MSEAPEIITGQEVETPVETPVETAPVQETPGQANEAVAETADFNPIEFASKKGWKFENVDPQTQEVLKSYYNLEKKLGNWSEVEENAKRYSEITPQLTEWQQKAQQWDNAQRYLDELEQSGAVDQMDYSKMPTSKLADLWQSGKVGLGDLPPEKQSEVFKYAQAQENAFNSEVQRQSDALTTKFPIIKENPTVARLVANEIEKGVFDPKTGRELSPEEITQEVVNLFNMAEAKGEQRVRQETQELKEGNLERTSSSAKTIPNYKSKSVFDAFKYAKDIQGVA